VRTNAWALARKENKKPVGAKKEKNQLQLTMPGGT
jgi:hypothetical protein